MTVRVGTALGDCRNDSGGGVDAAAFAAIRADALLDAGDLEGSAVWRNTAKETEKLEAEEPGETVQ